ncbi:MAG: Gfo/Idh/MocA family oxidoreductase [Pseudomonas sp.]
MVGGGPGSFMGPVHRRAAALDGLFEVVAGAFSRDPGRNAGAARPCERLYPDYAALIDGERALPPEARAEVVTVLTPNRSHAEVARAALAAGFAVLCEKPLAHNLETAMEVVNAARAAAAPLVMAYTYLGYPMVHELRARVAAGAIGVLRRVTVSYVQGWLAEPVEQELAGAAWRTDPAQAGISGCFGDIGVHAQSLVEFVTGQGISEVMADLGCRIPGRCLDDDGALLFRLESGVPGTLVASQVCAGEQNRLELALFGDKGALRWEQQRPGEVLLSDAAGYVSLLSASPTMLDSPVARGLLRLPGGHPEGYLEALANIYRALALRLRPRQEVGMMPLADADSGLRSLAFVKAALASSASGRWTSVED